MCKYNKVLQERPQSLVDKTFERDLQLQELRDSFDATVKEANKMAKQKGCDIHQQLIQLFDCFEDSIVRSESIVNELLASPTFIHRIFLEWVDRCQGNFAEDEFALLCKLLSKANETNSVVDDNKLNK